MAQQSSHTSIHYGSTKPADVQIEKIYITFAAVCRAAVNAVPANVLMARGLYGILRGEIA